MSFLPDWRLGLGADRARLLAVRKCRWILVSKIKNPIARSRYSIDHLLLGDVARRRLTRVFGTDI